MSFFNERKRKQKQKQTQQQAAPMPSPGLNLFARPCRFFNEKNKAKGTTAHNIDAPPTRPTVPLLYAQRKTPYRARLLFFLSSRPCRFCFLTEKQKQNRHNSRQHRCPHLDCGRLFDRPSKLATHEKTHAARFVCQFGDCGRAFVLASGLNLHLREEHPFR